MRAHPLALITLALVWFFAGRASADTLYITEFVEYSPVTYQAAKAPSNGNQTVTITASSAQSAAFKSNTRLIRVHCDVACHIEIGGAAPTATVTSPPMVAGQTEYFYVTAGAKVAVIAAAP